MALRMLQIKVEFANEKKTQPKLLIKDQYRCVHFTGELPGEKKINSKLHQLVRAVLCWSLPLDGSQQDTAELQWSDISNSEEIPPVP